MVAFSWVTVVHRSRDRHREWNWGTRLRLRVGPLTSHSRRKKHDSLVRFHNPLNRLHSTNIDLFLMPTLLADTNLFLWVDLEKATSEETKSILENVFHFHPLSIEDCVAPSPSPKVEEYVPKEGDLFCHYLFIVIHAVDYSRQNGVFATSELDFFLGKNFLVTYHDVPLKPVNLTEDRCLRGTGQPARAPDRVAHVLLDGLVENYKPALDELASEISELEQQALHKPTRSVLDKLLQIKKEVGHLRQIIGPQREVLARFRAWGVQADSTAPGAILSRRL